MADVHDKKTRSYNMSRIQGKNTKPETIVRKHLFSKGFRYRLHVKDMPGKPDLVLPKYKTVIFVHGCFWHGHEGCRYFVIPKTRTEWWLNKINGNRERDKENIARLKDNGWQVLTVFECQLKKDRAQQTIKEVIGYFGVTMPRISVA
ncbi:DNA mismatch endonuclease Vsr [Sinomicrobium pectinilyticum]|uniref:Very short patch repair endonuclease n=1 Tax=Sinomicrobium pectinilyticum TaxID=1084421 RepID=A0A3N0D060_SINP1|nr:very short patch repair endonuclease [Sinomicrobium pectinilyticum]RNL68643.1 DNA mismatch endonuclease Vsr [Sinomicrobium pectinilyticum]